MRWVLAALAMAYLPATALADRGEGFFLLGTSGNISFFRNPLLKYGSERWPAGKATLAVQSGMGIGVTDWLEVGIVGRVFLPSNVNDRETSTQGYPVGDTSYDTLSIQLPLTVTTRYGWGGSASIGLTVEIGLEWACWSLTSMSAPTAGGGNYAIDSQDYWSMSYLIGLEPTVEWRYFNHFAFRLGPRLIWTTTGTMHAGLNFSGTLLWGIGLF